LSIGLVACEFGGEDEECVTITPLPPGTPTDIPPTDIPPTDPPPTDLPPTDPPDDGGGTPIPMLTSGYYIPTESQARTYYGGNDFPVPAPTWVEDKHTFLIEYNSIESANNAGVAWSKNWADGWPAQYANEVLLYDYNYTCLQGSAQLDNGHYISCDTTYTWDGFFADDSEHTREDLIGFRWASEDEGSLLDSLIPFKTVAVCDTSALNGTIKVTGLPEEAKAKLREHGNPDAIFEVKDVGQGLCPKNSKDGNTYIDIFTGLGKEAYDDTWLFSSKPVQVIQY
jgi:hypothetical protein